MQPINWSGLVEAVIALLGAITLAITVYNNRQLSQVKQQQSIVSENLSQIAASHSELSVLLRKTGKEAPEPISRASNMP